MGEGKRQGGNCGKKAGGKKDKCLVYTNQKRKKDLKRESRNKRRKKGTSPKRGGKQLTRQVLELFLLSGGGQPGGNDSRASCERKSQMTKPWLNRRKSFAWVGGKDIAHGSQNMPKVSQGGRMGGEDANRGASEEGGTVNVFCGFSENFRNKGERGVIVHEGGGGKWKKEKLEQGRGIKGNNV